MPLGAAIGTGKGLSTAEMIRIIIRDAQVPVIVDAGLRAPSEAAQALEMGCEAVLVNSAMPLPIIQKPWQRPLRGVESGRAAWKGINAHFKAAVASSPLTSFLPR